MQGFSYQFLRGGAV